MTSLSRYIRTDGGPKSGVILSRGEVADPWGPYSDAMRDWEPEDPDFFENIIDDDVLIGSEFEPEDNYSEAGDDDQPALTAAALAAAGRGRQSTETPSSSVPSSSLAHHRASQPSLDTPSSISPPSSSSPVPLTESELNLALDPNLDNDPTIYPYIPQISLRHASQLPRADWSPSEVQDWVCYFAKEVDWTLSWSECHGQAQAFALAHVNGGVNGNGNNGDGEDLLMCSKAELKGYFGDIAGREMAKVLGWKMKRARWRRNLRIFRADVHQTVVAVYHAEKEAIGNIWWDIVDAHKKAVEAIAAMYSAI